MLFKYIGIAGALIVTISNIPQLVLFWQQKHAKGISVLGNWVGLVGVGLRTIYLWHSTHGDVISLAPYFFAIACILYTKYYIYFPSDKETLEVKAYLEAWNNPPPLRFVSNPFLKDQSAPVSPDQQDQ